MDACSVENGAAGTARTGAVGGPGRSSGGSTPARIAPLFLREGDVKFRGRRPWSRLIGVLTY